jgi:hypothetical protein
MGAEIRCWWCGTEAADTEVVATMDGTSRYLVIEWPDHRQDHEHSATPPSPDDLSRAGLRAFLRAIGATE